MTDGIEPESESYAEQSRHLEELLIQRQKWLGDASHRASRPTQCSSNEF